jgi:hypothetical protein
MTEASDGAIKPQAGRDRIDHEDDDPDRPRDAILATNPMTSGEPHPAGERGIP